ncbi:MAG: cysteine--tRNA ligase [Chlamydiales bacterium]
MDEKRFIFPKLPIYLYNTATRKKEIFRPQNTHVRMYTCGPTIYDYAHIGNFRTYVFEDLLRRTLKFFGYQVHQVMNLTDIDDKTIRGSITHSQTLKEFTEPYKNAFFADIDTLGLERAENYPSATDHIPHMITFIQHLLDQGMAYQSKDKSIYYAIDKFPHYGQLSHLDVSKIGLGHKQIVSDEYEKENLGDFVLWKAHNLERDGNIFWESPFGPGRPGWHIECSTMARHFLGETLDLHVGGVDNIFPHHENEKAQSEALSGKKFVSYWLHAEHLVVNHKKMSKSLKNFYTLRDLLDRGYQGMQVRYMLMHTHYRTCLNFTFKGMEGAKVALQRLNDFVYRMEELSESSHPTGSCDQPLQEAINFFSQAMADDLNISVALGAVFEMMRGVNHLYDEGMMNGGDAYQVLIVLKKFNSLLGVLSLNQLENIPNHLQEMLKARNEARAVKDWILADRLRDEIHQNGYLIEDTPLGSRLKKHS